MTEYRMPSWAKKQVTRWDRNGMVEDLCAEHGTGHPNKEWMESPENKCCDGTYRDSGVHGCCGCCLRKDE